MLHRRARRPNIIIIDEAQDFDDDEWDLVRELAEGAERFWIFHDPAQGFWRDRRVPADLAEPTVPLERPYRCHPTIQALADYFAGKPADRRLIDEGIAEGRIRIVAVENEKAARREVEREIDALLKDGLTRADIAIVSAVGQKRGALGTANSLGPHRLVRAVDPALEREIVAETFLRFKGLEHPAVIVTDIPPPGKEPPETRHKRLHIAVSRALSVVRVVGGGVQRTSFWAVNPCAGGLPVNVATANRCRYEMIVRVVSRRWWKKEKASSSGELTHNSHPLGSGGRRMTPWEAIAGLGRTEKRSCSGRIRSRS